MKGTHEEIWSGKGPGERAERQITIVYNPVETMEGAGVIIKRALPSHDVPYEDIDPFLLLDVFDSSEDSLQGSGPAFPKHPHRGFEILTYLLRGTASNTGTVGDGTVVKAGGIQKITTGRGIWHGEGGGAEDAGPVQGLQLWINLARAEKSINPDYQVLQPEEVPVKKVGGATVRTLVGEGSPIRLRTPTLYLDVTVPQGPGFTAEVPSEHHGFVFVLEGAGRFGSKGTLGKKGQLLVLGSGRDLKVAPAEGSLRFILGAAKPRGEPVRWNGPFVD